MLRKIACKIIFSVLFTLSFVSAVNAQPPLDAIEGLDPVLLTQGKEAQGELKITVTRGKFRYMFANEANKAAFEKDPERYEIQLDGACARMGAPVTGIADLYAVHKGRLYIFGSENCKTMFVAAPEKYLPPESGSSALTNATPEALKQGQAWLEKAVAAMGGAAKIDGLTSYHEKNTSTQTRGRQGEFAVKNNLLLAFPDRSRLDVEMPDYNDPTTMRRGAFVLQPGNDFVITPRGPMAMQAPMRNDQEQQLQRKPLLLLRARKGFKVAYIGTGKAGTTAVEQVVVDLAGGPYTLGFDPASGRLLSLTSKRRGPRGDFGEFVQIFSDFRAVDGLTLPFKITATFDGQPWPDQSATIEAITINSAVDPAQFEKPKSK